MSRRPAGHYHGTMTLFEYLSVLVSIILSFGIIRLLEGIPVALKRDGGYPIQGLWVIIVLWLHVHVWWVLWSYRGAAWNYPRFLIALASPLLLYSLAITLVPRGLEVLDSWRDHFYSVRVRFFVLLAAWMAVVSVVNWQVLEYPLLSRIRLGHLGFIALCGVGAASRQPRVQALVVGLNVVVIVLLVAGFFFAPGALAS